MVMDRRDSDKEGNARAGRIARQAHGAGEAAGQRAPRARARGGLGAAATAELAERLDRALEVGVDRVRLGDEPGVEVQAEVTPPL